MATGGASLRLERPRPRVGINASSACAAPRRPPPASSSIAYCPSTAPGQRRRRPGERPSGCSRSARKAKMLSSDGRRRRPRDHRSSVLKSSTFSALKGFFPCPLAPCRKTSKLASCRTASFAPGKCRRPRRSENKQESRAGSRYRLRQSMASSSVRLWPATRWNSTPMHVSEVTLNTVKAKFSSEPLSRAVWCVRQTPAQRN